MSSLTSNFSGTQVGCQPECMDVVSPAWESQGFWTWCLAAPRASIPRQEGAMGHFSLSFGRYAAYHSFCCVPLVKGKSLKVNPNLRIGEKCQELEEMF